MEDLRVRLWKYNPVVVDYFNKPLISTDFVAWVRWQSDPVPFRMGQVIRLTLPSGSEPGKVRIRYQPPGAKNPEYHTVRADAVIKCPA